MLPPIPLTPLPLATPVVTFGCILAYWHHHPYIKYIKLFIIFETTFMCKSTIKIPIKILNLRSFDSGIPEWKNFAIFSQLQCE
jgi:hypothetical protein